MCGIVGVTVFGGEKVSQYSAALVQARDRLEKRGPDSFGLWSDTKTAFGHRRLSILDLSENGHQPMLSGDGRYVITFNGEIYNYAELREKLELEGINFRSHSDTEVLVEGYGKWGGNKLLQSLNGMFAFAIWDKVEEELFLARDRFGKKPLCYYADQNSFAFSSTITSLIQFPFVSRDIDENAIAYYLQSLCVPAGLAIFKGVHKLAPASWLVIGRNGKQSHGKYWTPPLAALNEATLPQLLDQYEILLGESVKRRLISDVPVGVFLSGGIDSSLVARFASIYQPKISTFTISFAGTEHDEAKVARKISKILKTSHHEELMSATRALQVVPDIATSFDEPFADVSAIPTLLLSEVTRKQVTVALSGDGGDELWGGYHYHRLISQFINVFKYTTPQMRKGLASMPTRLLPYSMRLAQKALAQNKLSDVYTYMRSPLKECTVERLMTLESTPSLSRLYSDFFSTQNLQDPFTYGKFDFFNTMVDDYLVKVDRAAMAHSLEVRSPFLDVKLVEWIWNVPFNQKLNKKTKALSRSLLRRYLPDSITQLPKRGFTVPIRSWFRNELKEEISDLAHYKEWEALHINRQTVGELIFEHGEGSRNHESVLWSLWVLRLWHENLRS